MEKNVALSERTKDDKGVSWTHAGGKFRRLGPASCTESELLAIVLGSGSRNKTAHESEYFKKFYVNREIGTICWPDGVDIAPETLYHEATGEPLPSWMTKEKAMA